jgi:hypothetical protein
VVSRKLGEVLIDRGAITADQLEAALRNQLMLGGHLGTCLLELAFVDEAKLGDALAEAMGVPFAKPELLQEVDPRILQSLSKRVVEEYQAVPFLQRDKLLHVAMINPRDLLAIDALAFASGCNIVPWVAPEARILEAMERLYDIPRRTRYIVLTQALNPLAAAAARDAQKQESRSASSRSPSLATRATPLEVHEPGPEYGYGRSWVEVAEELAAKQPSFDAPEDDGAVGDLASELCAGEEKDAIARAILKHALRTMKRAILLVVQGDELVLWQGAGFATDLNPSDFGAVEIRDVALLDQLLGRDHYHGPLGDTQAHREIYERLAVPAPREIFLVPIHVNDRLVALFLGDGGPEGRVVGEPREGLRLARLLGLALNLVILKKKIRNLGSLTELASR